MSRLLLPLFLIGLLLLPMTSYASGGGGGEGGGSEGGPEYVEMEQITIPVVTDKGINQQFTFTVSLEVDAVQKEQITKFKPRLTDAYIQDLYGALGAGYGFMKNGVIDVSKVKHRLKEVTNSLLEPFHLEVHDVLLRVVQQYSF